ncbi:MAG: ChaB family protein [Phormidesmis sp. CAN_BIN44]|nr:ChaB family protein [Phormidesmis sp. CAN_BIN44]
MAEEQTGTGTPIGEPSEKAMSNRDADQEAAKRDDVDERTTSLPAEVTDQLMDGSDQVFLAAFNNSQKNGLSEKAAMNVAWNSVKQGFERSQDGSWHRKQKPGDKTISSGVESSAN